MFLCHAGSVKWLIGPNGANAHIAVGREPSCVLAVGQMDVWIYDYFFVSVTKAEANMRTMSRESLKRASKHILHIAAPRVYQTEK